MAFLEKLKNARKVDHSPSPIKIIEDPKQNRQTYNVPIQPQQNYKNHLRQTEPPRRLFTITPLHQQRQLILPKPSINQARFTVQQNEVKQPLYQSRDIRSSNRSIPQSIRNETKSNPILKYSKMAAPPHQFKRYIDNCQNVFYDKSPQYRKNIAIKLCGWFFGIVLLIVIILFGLAKIIEPLQDRNIHHGSIRNGVLYCDVGYVRHNNECQLDIRLYQQAADFAKRTINKLRYQWGDASLNGHDQNIIPHYDITEILNQIDHSIQSSKVHILYQQVKQFLLSDQNQNKYKFEFDKDKIYPTQKKRSIICSLYLFIGSWQFYVFIILSIIGLILGFKIFSNRKQNNRAWEIYNYLKDKLRYESEVQIGRQMPQLLKIGKIDQKIWSLVDHIRAKQGQITYYEDDNLYWKRL